VEVSDGVEEQKKKKKKKLRKPRTAKQEAAHRQKIAKRRGAAR